MRRNSSKGAPGDTLADQIARAMKVVSHGSDDLEKIAEETALLERESS